MYNKWKITVIHTAIQAIMPIVSQVCDLGDMITCPQI